MHRHLTIQKLSRKHIRGQSEQPNRQPHLKWCFGKGILLKWPWFIQIAELSRVLSPGMMMVTCLYDFFRFIFSVFTSLNVRIHKDTSRRHWIADWIYLWHINSTWKELTLAHKQGETWWNMVNRPFLYHPSSLNLGWLAVNLDRFQAMVPNERQSMMFESEYGPAPLVETPPAPWQNHDSCHVGDDPMNGADDSAKDQEPQEPPMHLEVVRTLRGHYLWCWEMSVRSTTSCQFMVLYNTI